MKIVNFGSCNIDYVYRLSQVVKGGETAQSGSMAVFAGGKGLNQSVAASRAGASVYHAGCLGTDGDMLKAVLLESGVDVSLLSFVNEKNGHAIIQVEDSGENAIFIHKGSNGALTEAYVDEVLSHFSENDMVMLQNEMNLTSYIIDRAFERGMAVIFNPSPISEALDCVDIDKIRYLVLNEHEAKALCHKESAEAFLDYMKETHQKTATVLTLGKRGCIYQEGEDRIAQTAFLVKAVDTTAAGDTFMGYFAAGVAEDMPKKEVLRTACAASALAVSKEGASPSIPQKEAVLSALPTLKSTKE
ncbi:MAG: ribokinase [Clostridia bacterium]|nr:ribokinase [Clostridia bacterium]